MARQTVTGLETHPAGSANPNSLINGNWQLLESIFAGKDGLFIPATSMTPAAGTAGAVASVRELGADSPVLHSLQFSPDTVQGAEFAVWLPRTYDLGSLTIDAIWTAAGSGGVRWATAALMRGSGDALDMEYPSETATTATASAANHGGMAQMVVTPAGSPGKEKLLFIRIRRLATDGADTLDAAAELLGVRIRFNRNQCTQA